MSGPVFGDPYPSRLDGWEPKLAARPAAMSGRSAAPRLYTA